MPTKTRFSKIIQNIVVYDITEEVIARKIAEIRTTIFALTLENA